MVVLALATRHLIITKVSTQHPEPHHPGAYLVQPSKLIPLAAVHMCCLIKEAGSPPWCHECDCWVWGYRRSRHQFRGAPFTGGTLVACLGYVAHRPGQLESCHWRSCKFILCLIIMIWRCGIHSLWLHCFRVQSKYQRDILPQSSLPCLITIVTLSPTCQTHQVLRSDTCQGAI